MSITFQRPWIIVATCLLASACTTEKTIIQEVPATTDEALADSTDTDTGVPALAAGTTNNTLITQTDIQVDTTAPIPAVENTLTPNMVDAIQPPAVESIVAPNMVDGVLTPAVESTVAPNMVDAIQTPAAESTVTPTMVDAVQTPTAESTVVPNIVDGTQNTGAQATATGAQTPDAEVTPTAQDTDLFFDPVSPNTDVSAETGTETVTATGTTTGATVGTSTDTATETTTEATTDTTTETAAVAPTGTSNETAASTTTGTTAESATGSTAGTSTEIPVETTAETTTDIATDFLSQNDPAAPTVMGTPGMSVNCALTLPCRWISSDTQFAVTVSNVDNIGEQDRLSIQYSIQTSHDTEVLIASTEPAVDENGASYEPSALELGQGIGGTAQGIMAADEVSARIEFDRSSAASSLSLWTIGLSDSGLIRQPSFSNMPVGSATTQHANCANTLPCVWVSPDANATITLLGVTGTGSTNRLSASFKVETTRNTVVAVDDGATAVGTDGMAYRGRTHAIGLETGAEKLTANAVPGGQVAGTTFFFTTQSMSSTLQNLSLIIYEDSPVPRWNPSFLSVPVQ